MSLIPLLLARLSAGAATVPAGAPGRYDPGSGHRPAAALVAAGLPGALLVAVALSPFEPPLRPIPVEPTKIVSLRAPPPPTDPEPAPPRPATTPLTSVPTRPAPPPAQPTPSATADPGAVGGATGDGPAAGTGTGAAPDPRPALVAAQPDARFAAGFQPDYPAREQRNGIEGVTRVRVLVGVDGRVRAVEEIESTSPGFFTETRRRALARWRFTPAMRGGVAEESWVVMTVRFRLDP